MDLEKEICKKTAEVYANKNWHHDLSAKEMKLVALLEKGGYIMPNIPANGFVGRAAS